MPPDTLAATARPVASAPPPQHPPSIPPPDVLATFAPMDSLFTVRGRDGTPAFRVTRLVGGVVELGQALASCRSLGGTKRLGHAVLMTPEPATYPGYRFPAEIISHAARW